MAQSRPLPLEINKPGAHRYQLSIINYQFCLQLGQGRREDSGGDIHGGDDFFIVHTGRADHSEDTHRAVVCPIGRGDQRVILERLETGFPGR